MEEDRNVILEFPCEFPLRVIGDDADDFHDFVVDIVRRHVPELDDRTISTQPSSNGRYRSIRMKFTATSRQQVDALYIELSSYTRVRFIL
jgi:putative lipoic acid-binding regulatory protein